MATSANAAAAACSSRRRRSCVGLAALRRSACAEAGGGRCGAPAMPFVPHGLQPAEGTGHMLINHTSLAPAA